MPYHAPGLGSLTFLVVLGLWSPAVVKATPTLEESGGDQLAHFAGTVEVNASATSQVAARTRPRSTDQSCFSHPRPAPTCRVFAVTDWGISFGRRAGLTAPDSFDLVIPAQDRHRHGTKRVTGDLGVMWNVGPTDAVGVSWFVTIDEIARTGPAVRYRRWLTGTQSLDVAVGLPIAVSESYAATTVGPGGSLLGLVRYNPVPWLGLTVRPEVVRLRTGYHCATTPCTGLTERVRRVLVGVEFSGQPGAISAAVFWGLVGLFSFGGGP